MKKYFLSFILSVSVIFSFAQSQQALDAYKGTASGTNSYSVTIAASLLTNYYDAERIYVKFTNANTNTSTLTLNGIGAKAIKIGTTALTSGDISAGVYYCLVYDLATTTWQIQKTASIPTPVSLANGGTNSTLAATLNTLMTGNVTTWSPSLWTIPSSFAKGDVMFASSTNVLSNISGNIAAGRKFLYSQGNGAANTATDFATIIATDIGSGGALTKTNDANVTLTLGGSPTNCLLTDASLTLGWTGQLSVPKGGSGNSTFTAYSVLCAGTTATGAFQNVSGLGSSGQVLTSAGAGALPAWTTISTGLTVGTTAIASGTIQRLLYETTGNVLGETSGLAYDPSNGHLGINGSPSTPRIYVDATDNLVGLSIASSNNHGILITGTNQDAGLTINNCYYGINCNVGSSSGYGVKGAVAASGNGSGIYGTCVTTGYAVLGSTKDGVGLRVANDEGTQTANSTRNLAEIIHNNTLGGFTYTGDILRVEDASAATANLFHVKKQSTDVFLINSSGFTGINVSPTSSLHIKGLGATSATFGFKYDNSSSTALLYGRDDGYISAGLSNGSMTIGYGSGFISTVSNTFLGVGVGVALTTGDDNVGIGHSPLAGITSGAKNIAIGTQALNSNNTGISNIAIGYQALATQTGAIHHNIGIGYLALNQNTTGTGIAIGSNALKLNTTGENNIAIGGGALSSNTTASDNISIGVAALSQNTTGTRNIALGSNALVSNTNGYQNFVGGTSAAYNLIGSQNTIVGDASMYPATAGDENAAFGQGSLRQATNVSRNTSIGTGSLNQNLTGNANVALGYYAGARLGGSDTLCIDNRDRGTNALTRTNALLIGGFAASPANQFLLLNGTMKISSAQTTVNNSVSGTTVFSQPQSGVSYKVVMIYFTAAVGTASYTYPVAFTNTPSVVASNDVASGIITSLSNTAVTATGTTTTGSIMLIGY